MRIHFSLKNKHKSVSICNKKKEIIIRYLGCFKFDTVTLHNPEHAQ